MKEITAKEGIIAAAISCGATLAGAYLTGSDAFSIQHQSTLKNIVFSNITFMGDSIFAFTAAAMLIFFFNKKDEGIRLLFTVLATLFITQIIKNLFSHGMPAQLFFENNAYYFEQATEIPKNIISSHTAVAFTLAAFFASLSKNKVAGILVFAAAAVVSFTRMYTAGEALPVLLAGIVPAVAAAFIAEKTLNNKKKTSRLKNRIHRKTGTESLSWY